MRYGGVSPALPRAQSTGKPPMTAALYAICLSFVTRWRPPGLPPNHASQRGVQAGVLRPGLESPPWLDPVRAWPGTKWPTDEHTRPPGDRSDLGTGLGCKYTAGIVYEDVFLDIKCKWIS